MSRKKQSSAKVQRNSTLPVKTGLKPLALAMFTARKNWFELSQKDFTQYDCPEDI